MGKVHDQVKQFLLDLGRRETVSKKTYYSMVRSGDEQPVDVRVGRRHFEYQPDVIWERRGMRIIFEVAFTEDWRAIVGEVTCASLIPNVWKMYLIVPVGSGPKKEGFNEKFIKKLISLLREKFCSHIQYGVDMIPIQQEWLEMKKIDRIEKTIEDWLTKDKWIKHRA